MNFNGRFTLLPVLVSQLEIVDGIGYEANLAGDLIFNTESFVVEPPPGGNFTPTDFRVPFTMTGSVQGYAPAAPGSRENGRLLFDVSLFGTGIASQTKFFFNDAYQPAPLEYIFQETVSPTPEPASMILLGTGLIALCWRIRAH